MAKASVTDNPYIRGIAEFVSGLRYEAIPAEIIARIKLLILDSFGCGLFGADLEWSRILQERLGELDTTQSCVVWGTRHKLSAPHAALVNGTQVQGFELDDMHHTGILHSGSVMLPKNEVAQLRDAVLGLDELTDAAVLARLMATP